MNIEQKTRIIAKYKKYFIAFIIFSLFYCYLKLRFNTNVINTAAVLDDTISTKTDNIEIVKQNIEKNDGDRYFIVFNDLHGNPRYKKNGIVIDWKSCVLKPNETNDPNEPVIPQFGTHACDAPTVIMYSMFDYLKKQNLKPDFLVWLGDSMVHFPDNEFNNDDINEYIGNLSQYVYNQYPNVPVFPVFGNHDQKPHSVVNSDVYSNLYSNFYFKSKWSLFFDKPTGEEFIKDIGFYSAKIDDHTTMLVLNTLIYYLKNNLVNESLHDDPLGQFKWLETHLQNSQQSGHKVLLVIHFSPGKFEFDPSYKSTFKTKYNKIFLDIIQRYHDVILGILAAHLHVDTFRLFNTDNADHVVAAYVHPSLSTYFKNPGFRVYKYSRSKAPTEPFKLLDYDQYYFNLTEANQLGSIDWKLEYNFKTSYKGIVDDLSGKSMYNLLNAIKTNNSVYDLFINYTRVGTKFDLDFCEPAKCKKLFFCTIEHSDMDKYDLCYS